MPRRQITAGGDRADVQGRAVAIVPPGTSEIFIEASGPLLRLFSDRATDLLARCRNADVYATRADPNVAPFAPWPDPPDGHRIRVYPSPT